ISLAALSACSTVQTAKTIAVSEVILADLARADGSWAGVATISKRGDGVFLSLAGEAAAPGTYGMHIHGIGKCQGPAFDSAGPHWNPALKQHGRDNPTGAHGGDLPNVVAGADRKFTLEQKLDDVMLEGVGGIIDADGAALVIHEKPDDYLTDPSGNSGKRVICGVFKSGNRS
ncbi:MAG TPA: superoxide dismutase family protein, partial [Sphingorhabdus sp.]|nr:superoxide dismutase family protein [Sphingorhabdus sp.]